MRNITLALALLPAALLPVAGVAQTDTGGGAAPVAVVALGDSLTAGYGLPEGEGLVPQLQAWLDARGAGVTVVNAGVSGDTSAGGLSRLDWSLTPETGALVVTLGGNDLLRGIPPEATRANLDAIVAQATARGLAVLVVPMEAPGNYGPEYKAAFDALYAEVAGAHGAAVTAPFFRLLAPEATDPAQIAEWMQPDGLHPNRAGVARIVERLGPEVVALARRAGG